GGGGPPKAVEGAGKAKLSGIYPDNSVSNLPAAQKGSVRVAAPSTTLRVVPLPHAGARWRMAPCHVHATADCRLPIAYCPYSLFAPRHSLPTTSPFTIHHSPFTPLIPTPSNPCHKHPHPGGADGMRDERRPPGQPGAGESSPVGPRARDDPRTPLSGAN